MTNVSYQEKTIYVNLLILLVLFAGFLGYSVQTQSAIQLGSAVVLLVILQIIGQSILAANSKRRLVDERDRQVKAHGSRVGYIALITCIWVSFGFFLAHDPARSLLVINVLVVALVIAELSSLVAQLISYRTSL